MVSDLPRNGDQFQQSLVERQNQLVAELQRILFMADYRDSLFWNVLALDEDLPGIPCDIVIVLLRRNSVDTLFLHAVLEPVEHLGCEKTPQGVDLLVVFGCPLMDCSTLSNEVLNIFKILSDNLHILGTIKFLWLMWFNFLNDQVLVQGPSV